MPLYTYENKILTDGGRVATTGDLCCGACCVDGNCTDKNKCDCDKADGKWHAGKSCGDSSFSCESSSSSSSSSSYSSASSASSCVLGACCTRIEIEPDPDPDPDPDPSSAPDCSEDPTICAPNQVCYQGRCVYLLQAGNTEEYWSELWRNTAGPPPDDSGGGDAEIQYRYECMEMAAVVAPTSCGGENNKFFPCLTCDEIDCSKAWDSSSSSSSASPSSSSSKISRRGGWVCKPVWVCDEPCVLNTDCRPICYIGKCGYIFGEGDNKPALPDGFRWRLNRADSTWCAEKKTFLPENGECEDAVLEIERDGETVEEELFPAVIPGVCCDGECCDDPYSTGCCDGECYDATIGDECCPTKDGGEELRSIENDEGCCTKADGAAISTKVENCQEPGDVFELCADLCEGDPPVCKNIAEECDECETDEDCLFCPEERKFYLDGDVVGCCHLGYEFYESRTVEINGDPVEFGPRCWLDIEGEPPQPAPGPPPQAWTQGNCCDGQCQEEECPPGLGEGEEIKMRPATLQTRKNSVTFKYKDKLVYLCDN